MVRPRGRARGRRFLAAVERTAELALAAPHMGPVRSYRNARLAGVRMMPVRDFERHLLFYRPRGDRVSLVGLLHGARDLEGLFRRGA